MVVVNDSGRGSGGSGDVNEQRVNDLRGVIVNSSRVAKQTRKLHKNFKCVRIDGISNKIEVPTAHTHTHT